LNHVPLLLVLAMTASAPPAQSSPDAVALVKAGRLLDRQAPSGAKIIDLGAATLLPGLIDSRTHLFIDVVLPVDAEWRRLKQMRGKGMFFDFAPTFYGDFYTKMSEQTIVMSPAFHDFSIKSDVTVVLKAGVKFAAGTDMCWHNPGKTCGQASVSRFPALHDAGMSSLDVIRAITTNTAGMLGWQDRIGAIEPRKFADLVAASGDLIADIHELERVRFILKNGEVVKNDLIAR